MPNVIIRNRFAPVSNNAQLTKDKLMMPANGKTVLCGKIMAKTNMIGTRMITVTHNSLRPARIGQSRPI